MGRGGPPPGRNPPRAGRKKGAFRAFFKKRGGRWGIVGKGGGLIPQNGGGEKHPGGEKKKRLGRKTPHGIDCRETGNFRDGPTRGLQWAHGQGKRRATRVCSVGGWWIKVGFRRVGGPFPKGGVGGAKRENGGFQKKKTGVSPD